ncbi:MAG: hypothetical protein IJ196_08725 [Prevotella sp.]|nr:hypothetical protein [Prevotella sp.]
MKLTFRLILSLTAVLSAVEQASAQAFTIDPQPREGTLVSRKEGVLGSIVYTFGNGARAAFIPTTFYNQPVDIRGLKPGGLSLFGETDRHAACIVDEIVAKSSLGPYTCDDIQELNNSEGLFFERHIEDYYDSFYARSKPEQVEDILRLIYLSATQAHTDTVGILKGFEAFSKRIEFSHVFFFQQALNDSAAVMKRNGILRKALPSETLRALNADPERFIAVGQRAFELYRQHMDNFCGFTLCIGGAIREESLLPLLLKYIATLPSKQVADSYCVSESDKFCPTDRSIFIENDSANINGLRMMFVQTEDVSYDGANHFLQEAFTKVAQDKLRRLCKGIAEVTFYVSGADFILPQSGVQLNVSMSMETDVDPAEMAQDVRKAIRQIADGDFDTAALEAYQQGIYRGYPQWNSTNAFKIFLLRRYYHDGEVELDRDVYRTVKAIMPADIQRFARNLLEKGHVYLAAMRKNTH